MLLVTPTYKLEELAALAGVSARTVRYYVQRGLLPAPEFRGKDTAYGREHLLRLHAVKRLQEAHLALDEIQVRLANATIRELEALASDGALPSPRGPFDPLPDSATDKKGQHPYRSSGRTEPRTESPPLTAPWAFTEGPAPTAQVYRLAPGVELWVRSGLDAASRALVREILTRYSTDNDEKDSDR
ncbi:MAG: MerR family transcriptional regulator [Polyangiaceae bacterium]